MPVYQISEADLQKIRDLKQYAFLADNAKVDHGTHWTITLSHRSRDMLVRLIGIEAVFVHDVHHIPPPAAAAAVTDPPTSIPPD